MRDRRYRPVGVCTLIVSLLVLPGWGQQQTPASPAQNQGVPKDLRPLLVPPHSEMRLVTLRYTADRNTLNRNYTAGGLGGGGRGGANIAAPSVSLSRNRVARLKRFDRDWQAALASLDVTRMSAAARSDLEALEKTIRTNLDQLDADATGIAELAPLVPFAPSIIQLGEARTRIEDIDPEQAAGVVTAMTKQIALIRARVESGLPPATTPDALCVGKDLATRAAAAVEMLRGMLGEWFTFCNGYDPLFTWWMGLPFKQADAALQGYAALLRDRVAPADLSSPNVPAAAAATIAPAPPPAIGSVPDLRELLALPQDEMTAIVQRFKGPGGGGPGGRGGEGGAAAVGVVRDRTFYEDWLAALRTLDFDALSRNAQVDYLFIRKSAEQQIARVGVTLPANAPRKADASGIPGAARGRQGLIGDLQDEFIPYTPEELIALADREFAWCEKEMMKASRQMGLGDDWKKALEKVKDIHPPPGGQVRVVRDLMFQAVEYLRARDLLTIPQVAGESLPVNMMTPERQLVNPFFTGGVRISVSYPTDTMEYDARIQSMRGNNTPFSHATAFHEMIPGHNLVFYMSARYVGYRASLGTTSFYGEGWPLYWEMLLYDLGFDGTPEEKVGALFWRMHRCARIIFSLRFHLGEWSPQECIDFLVERVGHERDNATAEVRRSFQGGYGPLYQAAYLLGGLQLRALRREIVDTRQMNQKAFHDEILRQGSMPIAFLRLALMKQKLTRDTPVDWRFYGGVSAAGGMLARQGPVPPIRTTLGPMPGAGELPVRSELPPVLAMSDGRPVTTPRQWRDRREEMKRILAYYAVGLMPPSPGNVTGQELKAETVLDGQVRYRLVHLSFGPGRKLGFDVAVFTPAAGKGPFPTVIFPSFSLTPGAAPLSTMPRPPEQGKGVDAFSVPPGDQAARAAAAVAASPSAGAASTAAAIPRPPTPDEAARAHSDLFRRGYALVTYHYQDTGEDTIGRLTDGSWAFRTTRFFPAYPAHDWGLLAGWAWGISRTVDFLEQQPFADRTRLMAAGHSRIGKAVLVAGAFDERLALVAPAGSGAGGTGAYRFNGADHGGREGLADMMRKYPNWFSPHLYEFAAHVEKLPFDQHWLIALVAPRAFIALEGADDQNCVPNAVRQAWLGARPAFALLQATERLGVSYADHRHALTADDWAALLDFADLQLRGLPVARRFDRFPPESPAPPR